MKPLVSAVVTFHNQACFVKPALESVLGQSYGNLETIVVDDGSTDDTRERCAPYGDRIRLISRPNGGVAAARNTGLAAARGVYVAHIDGDDVWHPDKIAAQVDAAHTFPDAGMIVANGHTFAEAGPRVPGLIWGEVAERLAGASTPALRLDPYRALLRRHCISTPSQMMIPTSVFRVLGGWDPRFLLVSDVELALRIAARYPFVFLRDDLVGYRYLDSSLSGPRASRTFTWSLETFGTLRLHRRQAATEYRALIDRRIAADSRTYARDAYHVGRRGNRGWAIRYALRLLLASRRPHLVGPYLLALLVPAGVVSAARRLLRLPPTIPGA